MSTAKESPTRENEPKVQGDAKVTPATQADKEQDRANRKDD